jgi:hypothetical protein
MKLEIQINRQFQSDKPYIRYRMKIIIKNRIDSTISMMFNVKNNA